MELNEIQRNVVIIALDDLVQNYKSLLEANYFEDKEDEETAVCLMQEAQNILYLFKEEIEKPKSIQRPSWIKEQ